ncbi:Sugar phosphate isomerase/epimerase [Bacillus sp. OV166]|uniref:sugar phosphate isomerase/epimerase family protein n=1 Tax=Bacillus sp. OV166 TaxID=1882763 RepID=UPI000A2AE1A2|nr:sugar phosphate isomerase/epimerase family protein [Bacillus sp. OV166]SMQ86999.1 Sugar phosphate isomerase/epimerase [Bacillus sp. OV166]
MELSICSWTFGEEPIEKVAKFVKDTGWPDENKDLANRNPVNRKKAIEYFKRQIEAVNNVNGRYLIVCPSAVGKSAPMGNGKEDWEWAVDSIHQLTEKASELDVKLIIEPLNRYESCIVNSADDAYRFVNEINHPIVKTLLDTYHMNIEEKDMVEPFRRIFEMVEVVHVADNNRQGLGRGQLPFQQIFSELQSLKYDGTIVVECCTPGANPFSADKGRDNMQWMYKYAEESLVYLKKWFQ